MSDYLQISLHSATHTGMVRDHNEDNHCVLLPDGMSTTDSGVLEIKDDQAVLLAVADGMGGTEAGEVASQIAVETVLHNSEHIYKLATTAVGIEASLRNLIVLAHEHILDMAAAQPESKGMGTTLILAYLQKNMLYLSWSGDSRAYVFNSAGVQQLRSYDLPKLKVLSDDHSMVWDKVRAGEISPDQARVHEYSNVITQSLGDPFSPPKPDTAAFDICKGEKLLLCSDGLNSMLPDEFIQEVLSGEGTNEEIVNRLIEAANTAGGYDNITVILLSVIKVPPSSGNGVASTEGRPQAITARSGTQPDRQRKSVPVRMIKRRVAPLFLVVLLGIVATLAAGWYITISRGNEKTDKQSPPVSGDRNSKAAELNTGAEGPPLQEVPAKPLGSVAPQPDRTLRPGSGEHRPASPKENIPAADIPKPNSDNATLKTEKDDSTSDLNVRKDKRRFTLSPWSIEQNIQYAWDLLSPYVAKPETPAIRDRLKKVTDDLRLVGNDAVKLELVNSEVQEIYQEITALVNKYPDDPMKPDTRTVLRDTTKQND